MEHWRLLFHFGHIVHSFVFVGSHTASRIYDKYVEVLTQYEISQKVNFVVTDNAANMKAAFNARFPLEQNDADSSTFAEEDPTDNEDLWSNETLDESVNFIESERLLFCPHPPAIYRGWSS